MPSPAFKRHPSSYFVRIEWDLEIQAFRLYTPYDKSFVEALKQLIPHSDRAIVFDNTQTNSKGNPKFSHWIITERFLEPIKKTCQLRWGEDFVFVLDKAAALQAVEDEKKRQSELQEKQAALRAKLLEEARKRGINPSSRRGPNAMDINSQISPIERTILDFVQMLPYEALKRAYQIGAMQLHPDRASLSGIRPEEASKKMSDFNAKWQEIETVFYLKSNKNGG